MKHICETKLPNRLFWDLDARNHEVTMLKIKNIRLKERYGEGELYVSVKAFIFCIISIVGPGFRDCISESIIFVSDMELSY